MGETKTKQFDPASLNNEGRIIWFDDFNEDKGKEPTNQYRFLSNFYVGEPIVLPGVQTQVVTSDAQLAPVEFMTGEHAFQALKATTKVEFLKIAKAPTPSKAKALGRKCILRDDWEAVKLDVMAAVVRSKFTLKRDEGTRLLQTKDALLVEGTLWGDDVWGVDLTKKGWPGRNWLGTLLMARRAELKLEALGFSVDTADHNMQRVLR